MPEYVIQIDFTDRKGLGYEIFQAFEDHGCDKVFMEVAPGQGMLIKARSTSAETVETLMHDIRRLEGVNSVGIRSQMAYEDRENELRTILNSVNEGIIAIDQNGIVTHLNESACLILDYEPSDIVGRRAAEILGADTPLSKVFITGQTFPFHEGLIHRNHRAIRFLASYVPIINDSNKVIGVVVTVKAESQIKEMISKFDSSQHMISFTDIVYRSEKMKRLVDTAKVVARGNATVLLRGESGTGKELLAKSVHNESARKSGPFVAVNCSSLPASLLESELFGYDAGAFTGALKTGKTGLFEQAHKGTLFLDEVGELSLPMQAQLLRVLQEGTIRRVGGTREIAVDVRIVAATHRNLESMIAKGMFREDLYYRLNVIPLRIPPLRERPEDISVIVEFLLSKISRKMRRNRCHITRESMSVLELQEWPGNVRQLENLLERILNVLPDNQEITPEHLYEWTDVVAVSPELNGTDNKIEVAYSVDEGWPALRDIVATVEKQILTRVLREYPSSRKAGTVLGVSNTTILNKIKAYNIPVPHASDK
ncbi:sigma 54-interacting transcriptional regulator [Alicyclobacillus sp. SO9]|uniref:sigma 54-interacting transcriptional regulator n=1 Tax=Alicyclobacillus sp. SO9 TaxID=2665646 RepID=UPI0018E84837|nr:sigma 54-interacting transcriptional regulator [Alicyclobacillus sp. SO9]QQE79620.1 sigma 54-interacting transcriptional regulator [Alicyclobacillus sp. SO9]